MSNDWLIDLYYKAKNKFTDVFHRNTIKFWWQRKTRGFDDSDLWSLDNTIMKFVLPRLKAFRDKGTHGFPVAMYEELDPTFNWPDFDSEKEQELCDKAAAKWDEIINEMVWAIEQYVENDGLFWNETTKSIDKELEARYEKGMAYFHKYFHGLWD